MRTILLTQGQVALVDDEDFEIVHQFKWYANLDKHGRWYAYRNFTLPNGNKSLQGMHRFVTGLEYGDPHQVDHLNREQTLNNTRDNLRVTLCQNQQNVGLRKDNTSGFKGVYRDKRSGKWQAQIQRFGKRISGGYFDTAIAAAAVYNYLAKNMHGEFAVLNDLSNAV